MNAIVDGAMTTVAGAAVPELPVGVSGVFETLLWRRDELVFASAHWARFEAGCRWHGFLPPLSAEEFERSVRALVGGQEIDLGVVRLAIWRLAPSRTSWRIDVGMPRPHMRRAEFSLDWGSMLPPATEDRAFKHLKRGAWGDALRTARSAGFDDALLIDGNGRVVEACVSNVFIVRDELLLTPALENGPLPGVMRAEVISFARRQGISVHETAISRTDVETAAEVWLTNSLIGIRPTGRLAGRVLPADRPMLDRFSVAWQQAYGWSPVVIAGVC